ncbi:MAG: hypothetical protein QRY74_04770 [Chlamydia sp.]
MNRLFSFHCPHFKLCPGCEKERPFELYPILYQQAKTFFTEISSRKIEPSFIYGEPIFWRTRAKLACRLVDGRIRFGIFEKGTHNLIPIPHCKVHHPAINRAIELLEKVCIGLGITAAYHEKKHSGLIRYIQCSVERSSQKVQMAIVICGTKEMWQEECSFIEVQLKKHLETIHSIWFNYNPDTTNRIYGDEWRHIFGPKHIWEDICEKEIPYLPSHFMQGNPELFEKLLKEVQNHLSKEEHLIELYAGMGVISIALRDKVASTLSIEENGESYNSFCTAKSRLSIELQNECQFIVGDSEKEYLGVEWRTHTLLVDPPRKGLSKRLVQSLSEEPDSTGAQKLIYISCHYPSLERDISALIESGKWVVSHASCYLFFPGTEHIETLVIMNRKKEKNLGEKI